MASKPVGKRQYSGTSRGVYVAAGLAMLAFIIAIVLSVDLASREADRVVLDRELAMVRLEIARQIEVAAQREAEFTYWDDAVEAIVRNRTPPANALSEQDLEWLFEDLGFSFLVVIDSADRLKFVAHRPDFNPGTLAASVASTHANLISVARSLFLERRVLKDGGYVVSEGGRGRVPGIHAGEMALVGGKPAIVVAQAIVPETEKFGLSESQVDIALAVMPLEGSAISELGTRLRLFDPRIVESDKLAGRPASQIELPRISDGAPLNLVWHPEAPRPKILRATLPFAGAICIAICAMLGFIVRRHGRAMARLAESEATNRHLASHDPMTGLMNRTAFDAAIDVLINNPQRREFGLLCIDLDRFKAVNDTHGHPAGDAVLREIAERLTAQIGEDGFVARLGGDEFIAAISNWRGPDEAQWLADSMVDWIRRPIRWQETQLDVGASIGVACWPQDGHTVRELIAAADAGLYAAKRAGRGRAISAAARSRLAYAFSA
jgi:diguanylate cyclase (GGDEF)-like protein